MMSTLAQIARNLASRLTLILCFTASLPVAAIESSGQNIPVLGSNIDALVAHVKAASPELRAAALSAEAALARVEGAGTLPDPTMRIEFRDIDRRPGSIIPDRLNRIDYIVEQEIPLWGKRDLARNIAGASADQAAAQRKNVELNLIASVKITFADYFAAHEAQTVITSIQRTVNLVSDIAKQRYALALGTQQDALMAAAEVTRLETEQARRFADTKRAAARLNALLNRPLAAPLALPESLQPLPPKDALGLEQLIARALASNPDLKAQDAAIVAATDARTLVKKSWYPDVTLGLSAVDQSRRWQGYEAMVCVKVPLNWRLRQAEARATTTELEAARSRREAIEANVRGKLEVAFWTFEEAQKVAVILEESYIPQRKLALESAIVGYQQNRTGLNIVLDAERRALENKLEHLSAKVSQQRDLAEIEKLIGGEL